jgi:hypothetical protein
MKSLKKEDNNEGTAKEKDFSYLSRAYHFKLNSRNSG